MFSPHHPAKTLIPQAFAQSAAVTPTTFVGPSGVTQNTGIDLKEKKTDAGTQKKSYSMWHDLKGEKKLLIDEIFIDPDDPSTSVAPLEFHSDFLKGEGKPVLFTGNFVENYITRPEHWTDDAMLSSVNAPPNENVPSEENRRERDREKRYKN